MAKKVTQFEKSLDDENIILAVPYAEVYIPYDIMKSGDDGKPVAYKYGEGIRTVGLFNIRFYNSDEDDRESSELRTFNYPNVITMYPSDMEIAKLKLADDMEMDKYYVLKFYKGDIIMKSKIQQKSQNCEAFMDFLIKGKLPKGISYTDLYFAWLKNFKINKIDPGVPAVILQMIISENCRSKDDPLIQFRKVINNKGVSLYDYKVHNMVELCANSSVFNSLIFERFGEMLTSAINMTKEGVKQNTTPLEKVMYV